MSTKYLTSTMDTNRYGGTAIALHWLIFTLIACGFALGGLYAPESKGRAVADGETVPS